MTKILVCQLGTNRPPNDIDKLTHCDGWQWQMCFNFAMNLNFNPPTMEICFYCEFVIHFLRSQKLTCQYLADVGRSGTASGRMALPDERFRMPLATAPALPRAHHIHPLRQNPGVPWLPHPGPRDRRQGQLGWQTAETEFSRNVRVEFGFGRGSGGAKLLIYLALCGGDTPKFLLFSGSQEKDSSG